MTDINSKAQSRRYRTPEAADYLGLSPSMLNKLRVFGGGPVFHKCGRAVIYDTADLDNWLRQQRRATTSDQDGAVAA